MTEARVQNGGSEEEGARSNPAGQPGATRRVREEGEGRREKETSRWERVRKGRFRSVAGNFALSMNWMNGVLLGAAAPRRSLRAKHGEIAASP